MNLNINSTNKYDYIVYTDGACIEIHHGDGLQFYFMGIKTY